MWKKEYARTGSRWDGLILVAVAVVFDKQELPKDKMYTGEGRNKDG